MSEVCKSTCKVAYIKFYPQLLHLPGIGTDAALFLCCALNYTLLKNDSFYMSNNEWREQLQLTDYGLNAARSAIATRVKSGMSKKPMTATHDDTGALLPLDHVVLYWKDGNNVMWYWVNLPLLNAYLEALELPEIQGFKGILKIKEPYYSKNQQKNQIQREIDNSSIPHEGADNSLQRREPEQLPQTAAFKALAPILGESAARFAGLDINYVRGWLSFVQHNPQVRNAKAYLIAMLGSNEPVPATAPKPPAPVYEPVFAVDDNDADTQPADVSVPCPHCGGRFTCTCDSEAVTEEIPVQPRKGIDSPVWTSANLQLELQLPAHDYDLMLRKAILLADDGNHYIFEVASPAAADKLNGMYKRNVAAQIRNICGEQVSIEARVSASYRSSNGRFAA